MPEAKPTRQRLLDAALELVAEDGVQAVTHRAVEQRAGVARGSTRYHFKTRDELLEALVDHVAQIDTALIEHVGEGVGDSPGLGDPPHDLDRLADGTPVALSADDQERAMRALTAGFLADPRQSLVRFELYLYAARRPELQEVMTRWRRAFLAVGAAYLEAQGAPQPEAGAALMSAAMDGIMLHALSSPHPAYQQWGPEWMARMAVESRRLGAGGDN